MGTCEPGDYQKTGMHYSLRNTQSLSQAAYIKEIANSGYLSIVVAPGVIFLFDKGG